MTTIDASAAQDLAAVPVRPQAATKVKKERANWFFRVAIAWLTLVAVLVLYPAIAKLFNAEHALGSALPDLPETWFFLADPNARDAAKINAGPSWEHLFGNASFGQDVLSRVVDGGAISLFVALVGTAVGIGLGGALGLLAGYLRGWVDSIVRLVITVTLSVPALLLVIFIVTVRSQSLFNVILAVCLLAVPAIARIVRGSTLQVADREYVKAAEVIGAKKTSILFREVLPNVMPTLISFAFLTTGIILVAESSLSFLGLSVEAPTITWGSIIAEGRIKFDETPHMVFMTALVLFLTVLSLNYVGDQLLKRYDIRESAL